MNSDYLCIEISMHHPSTKPQRASLCRTVIVWYKWEWKLEKVGQTWVSIISFSYSYSETGTQEHLTTSTSHHVTSQISNAITFHFSLSHLLLTWLWSCLHLNFLVWWLHVILIVAFTSGWWFVQSKRDSKDFVLWGETQKNTPTPAAVWALIKKNEIFLTAITQFSENFSRL